VITIHDTDGHKNLFFHDMANGAAVQANQHIIVDGNEAAVLDPGGHKIYARLFGELHSLVPPSGLKHIFLSHQDPDIVAAINGWLMATDATAYAPGVWTRFIPHFGVDELVVKRIIGVPDEGMSVSLNDKPLKLIPAHFLHSPGNFHVYDPTAKILYSGDLGASLGPPEFMVSDFDAHIRHMEAFHRRYMPSRKALQMWVAMARSLDIEIIAPQHGAVFGNRQLVERFIEWVAGLECGPALMGDRFVVPE